MTPEPADSIRILWEQLLVRWEDERAHRGFLEHCWELARLDLAAGYYREATTRSEHRATAEQQLGRIAALLLAALEQARADRPAPRAIGPWFALFVLLGLLALWLHLR